jgi:hypothetical protein
LKQLLRTYGRLSLLLIIALLYTGGGKMRAAENDTTLVDHKGASISGSVQKVIPTVSLDTIHSIIKQDSVYKPDPKKAIWYSVLCPGLGQLYNRRYWKLPFVGAGVIGVAYAINWNSKYYNAYTNAYRDVMDDDPTTTSYMKLLPPGSTGINESQLVTVLKNRQQKFRRSRDLSYIGAVGVYVICILDAFVDAQLYDFDISPDLSVTPSAPRIENYGGTKAVELSLAFRF